jgi:hypothetical protein
MDAGELLARYIELHNEAVHGSDDGTAVLFTEDADMEVEGPSISKLREKIIMATFRDHELMLWKIGSLGDDVAFANYAWKVNPRIGGLVRVQTRDGLISRLTLRPGYSRIFAALSDPPPAMKGGDGNAFQIPAMPGIPSVFGDPGDSGSDDPAS